MPTSNSSNEVHRGMFPLWEAVKSTLLDPDVNQQPTQYEQVRRIVLPSGATVELQDGVVAVRAPIVRFTKDSLKIAEVVFPENPEEDLSRSVVSVHSYEGPECDTSIPSMEEYPEIAEQLRDCLQARRAS